MTPYPLQIGDAAAMAALHGQAFDPGWPETDMAEHLNHDIVLGVGETLTGFVIIRQAVDQAEILTITIAENRRRTGLGQALLRAGELAAAIKGVEILFLEVAEDNQAALSLYRARGYEQIGRRPAYYRRAGGRVAALTFRKKLDLPGDPR